MYLGEWNAGRIGTLETSDTAGLHFISLTDLNKRIKRCKKNITKLFSI
jgi:hypothetical protein